MTTVLNEDTDMGNRQTLPKQIEKLIFQQCGSRCVFCDETDVSALQIHHIEPYAAVKTHDPQNLILVCGNCHGRWSFRLYTSITFENSSNSGIVANEVTIRNSRRRIVIGSPAGSIASDLHSRNYVKHLIDRYHEFKEADMGARNMKYAVLYAAIKKEFGAKWDYIPLGRFDSVTRFVQERIDKTILGKTMRAQGKPRYSTFGEYLGKHSS